MEANWTKKFMVLWLTCVVSAIAQTPLNEYCTKTNESVVCVFRNTTKVAKLNSSEIPGIRQLRIESASAVQSVVPCNVLLQVWSSNNVTMEGGVPENDNSRNKFSNASEVPAARNSYRSSTWRPILFVDNPPEASDPTTTHEKEHKKCFRNMSAQQSKFQSLRGEFDSVNFRFSEIEDIDANFSDLSVWDSTVSNMSASVERVSINASRILNMNKLVIGNPSNSRDAATRSIVTNILTGVNIEKIEHKGLEVVNNQLHISNTVLGDVYSEGIVVRNGSLRIANSLLVHGGPTCFVLQGKSSVVINNFTFGNRFIGHMEVSSTDQSIYPLQMVSTSSSGPFLRVGSTVTEGDEDKSFIGLQWYWIIIMLGVGLLAGVVMGAAVKTRNSKNPKFLASSLTLADLIARDRIEEGNGDNTLETEVTARPVFQRQDSGLTSSSFASYTACPERRRVSCLKQPDDLDHILNSPAEPNVYVQVSPLACAQESVIYEEAESFSAANENMYLTMASGVK